MTKVYLKGLATKAQELHEQSKNEPENFGAWAELVLELVRTVENLDERVQKIEKSN